jgi:hypothetical protein
MLVTSVTIAKSFMRPLHFGHSRTSIAKVLRRSSAQGRYLQRDRTGSGSAGAAVTSLRAATLCLGAMRARHLLADARTPAYFTVWQRGGGTLIASRHKRDNGSISTATVGEGALENDAHQAVLGGLDALLGDGWTEDVAKKSLATGGVERARAGGSVQREPIERRAERLVER